MKTIRIAFDEKMLEDLDELVAGLKITRSAFIESALRAAVKKHRVREMERKHAEGYAKHPQRPEEFDVDDDARDWGDDW